MATPIPKSYEQLVSEGLSTYASKIGVNDYYTGSAITSFFEAVAQMVYLANASNFSILRDFNLDRSSGEALKRIAAEERVRPLPARVSTGRVTIKDSSFQKISTKIYAGASAPNLGSSVLKVSDASSFPASGSVYIGRGTNNIEGPIQYNSITPVGGYFELNLATSTTKFHNISESVILAQGGNRSVAAGAGVVAPASGGAEDVNFVTTQTVILLDGENEIKNVPVAAQNPGAQGNIPRSAIKRFISTPFTGATVTNENQFTTGRDEESDSELKSRVKRARLSKGLGTANAVKNSVLNQQATDEAATIVSSEIFSTPEETSLYIDDGKGYEEKSQGVGVEFIVDQAIGGETNFQLATGGEQSSIAKAYIESNATSPFDVRGNDKLAISVGGIVTEHVFSDSNFRSTGAATAYEIIASVNANPNLNFSARTAEDGRRVAFFAKTEQREYIQKSTPVSGRDAGEVLGLPSNEVETLRLYRNGKLLSKNGRVASLETQPQQQWAINIASGDNLIISVDGTQSINYIFNDSDFIAEGSFVTVNKNNTLESWASVINNKVTGITATVAGNKLQISSNLGANSRSSLSVDPSSSLVVKGMFSSVIGLISVGAESDFTLSRNTAQFKLLKPLQVGDSLSAGTENTKANIISGDITGGSVNFTSDAHLWFLTDVPDATIIKNNVLTDSLLNISKPSANIVRYESSIADAFAAVQVGDWVIIRSDEVSSSNRLEGRVNAVTNTTLDIKITPSEFAASVVEGPIIFKEGVSITRTNRAVQKVVIPFGLYSLFQVAEIIQQSLIGVTCIVLNDRNLVITTKTEDISGSVMVIDYNDQGSVLGFEIGDFSQSDFSLFGYYESQNSENSFPAFVHSKITSDESADVPNALIDDFDSEENLDSLNIEENNIINMAGAFNDVPDNASENESVQIDLINANNINIDENKLIRRLRVNDRFYVTLPYDFSDSDSIVTVLDNDASNKTFPVPLYRRATVNSSAAISNISFRAFDSDSGVSEQFLTYFGADFNFKNFKAMMKARNVIHPTLNLIDEDALLIRSSQYGLTGEKIRVGYKYPTQPNLDITSTISVEDLTKISIFLKSGNLITNTIDGTTEWDVTVNPNVGYDEITYTWNGNGTNPNIGVSLSSGGYVSIGTEGEFNVRNTGIFKVLSATSVSFTINRPNGQALNENNRATLTNQNIRIYELSNTTASEINTYINANLSSFIESSLINDNGLNGSGVIDFSTYEDSLFSNEYVSLVDGQNYILSSDLSAIAPNPQFIFKRPLSLPSFSTATANSYTFNNGEVIKLIPTTAKQVENLVNVLAVSGVSTVGTIKAVSKDSKVQIKSEVLGSGGSVQIAGGRGNISTAEIQQAASRVSDSFSKVVVERSAIAGFHGDQWVKLQASNLQKKNTNISDVTVLDVLSNSPLGKSTVKLSNRQPDQLLFGQPRNFNRDLNTGFRVERHGILTAIMWNETGPSPVFSKNVEFNNILGDITVTYNTATGYTEYTAEIGTRIFLEASKGDKFIVQGFVNPENNGSFNVIGVSENGTTIVVDNFEGIDEFALNIPALNVSITSEIIEGDTLILNAPFSTLNRGVYRVIRRFENTVWIENPNSVEEDVTIPPNYLPLTFDGLTEFDISAANNGMKIEWNGNGADPSLNLVKIGDVVYLGSDFDINNQGDYAVIAKGDDYVVVPNANITTESSIQISDVFQIHRPSVRFYDYETTIEGDKFVVDGDILTENSVGSYNISEVLSQNEIVVDGILNSISNFNLGVKQSEIFIEEKYLYYGYKKVYNKSFDPFNINQGILVFDTVDQFLKINKDAGAVIASSVSKLEFPTTIKKGVDSYRYHTGLLRQANKVVYGEPRGTEFEGVAAAGAEINIQPPLVRRIEVSIVIRLNTGVPFVKIVEQVRNNIASLINSTGIGQSIPISNIVSAVNSISGVFAVSIASPSYSPSLDLISVNPSEKPLILDPLTDIIVSKVGA